jgi:hypothetical protein
MSLVTQIPLLNDLRFAPDKNQLPQFHMKHFDDVLFNESIADWQTNIDYFRPVELGDRITIMIHTQNNDITHPNPPVVEILDEYLNVIINLNTVSAGAFYKGIITYPGNYYEDVLMDTSLWTGKAVNIFAGQPEGYYYFRITNYTEGEEQQEFYFSEPIWLKETHEDTAIIKYGNITSRQDIVMTGFPVTPQFSFRVQCDIRPPVPVANFIAYTDVAFDQHMLSATSLDSFELTIGGYHGVPHYVMQKISAIFCADWRTIDGKRFDYNDPNSSNTGTSTAPIIQISTPNILYPLVTGKVPIKRTDNRDAYTFVSNKIRLWDSPGVYPYVLMPFFNMQSSTTTLIGKIVVFEDAGAEAAYLAYLQGQFSNDNDIYGSFTEVAGGFFYENAEGETFTENPIPTCTTFLTIAQTTAAANCYSKFDFSGGEMIIDWNDATTPLVEWVQAFSGTTTASHKYATAGNQSIRVFTDNQTVTMVMYPYVAAPSALVTISGKISTALQYFSIYGYDLSAYANMDFTFLLPVMPGLNQLVISCNINAFFPALFSGLAVGSMTHITFVNLSQNKLPTGEVNAAINRFKDAFGRPGGTFYIKFQTPPAPPNGSSAAARTALAAASWSVITD